MFLTLEALAKQNSSTIPFPNSKDESWRFNDISVYLQKPYELKQEKRWNGRFETDKEYEIRFENFNLVKTSLPASFSIKPFETKDEYPNPFLVAGQLYIKDPLFITADQNNEVTIYNGFAKEGFYAQKRFVNVLKNSSLKLIDIYESDKESFITVDMDITLEEGAVFHYTRINLLDATTVMVSHNITQVGKDADFKVNIYNNGGALTHESYESILDKNSKLQLHALTLAKNAQANTIISGVIHEESSSKSDQQAKEVLAHKSKAVFDTTSSVLQGTKDCEVYQHNAALLLDDSAQIHSKPHLKIYTDALIAQHGSTAGALDEEAFFYLQSRGLTEDAAHQILIEAFSTDMLDSIEDEVLVAKIKEFMGDDDELS